MEYFKNLIAEKGAVYFVSQAVGFVAAALLLLSYQQRTHRRIVAFQACAGFLFAVQYFLIGEYAGVTGNLVGFTRCITYYFRGKSKFADHIACPIIFAVLAGLGGLLTYESPVSLLPMAAMMISSFVIWSPKTQKLRALTMPTSIMWLIYNLSCGSISGTLTEILSEISIIIGLFRFRKKKEK